MDTDNLDSIESSDQSVDISVSFTELPLCNELQKAIDLLGFQYCTPIQFRSLPYTLEGNDVIGTAQTGTGKTAAFLIAIIQYLLTELPQQPREHKQPRALIIVPTRELAVQVAKEAKQLAHFTELSIISLTGGFNYDRQKQYVDAAPLDIVVATPGRLIDFVNRQDLDLNLVENLVIDEADRMLDMGFIPQVRRIIGNSSPKECRQTLMFSATFPSIIKSLAQQWTYEPVEVAVDPDSATTNSIEQIVYIISTHEKNTLLYNLLNDDSVENVIIFVNRCDQCQDLYKQLKSYNLNVGMINGRISQDKRTQNLQRFKTGQIRILVATDVAGRGIHVDNISHVINYSLPEDSREYIHRIGRTGRAGKTGISISFACEDDGFKIAPIEEALGHKLPRQLASKDLLTPIP